MPIDTEFRIGIGDFCNVVESLYCIGTLRLAKDLSTFSIKPFYFVLQIILPKYKLRWQVTGQFGIRKFRSFNP